MKTTTQFEIKTSFAQLSVIVFPTCTHTSKSTYFLLNNAAPQRYSSIQIKTNLYPLAI